jgi:hypothetical protein
MLGGGNHPLANLDALHGPDDEWNFGGGAGIAKVYGQLQNERAVLRIVHGTE